MLIYRATIYTCKPKIDIVMFPNITIAQFINMMIIKKLKSTFPYSPFYFSRKCSDNLRQNIVDKIQKVPPSAQKQCWNDLTQKFYSFKNTVWLFYQHCYGGRRKIESLQPFSSNIVLESLN